jgi:hypothetical protein
VLTLCYLGQWRFKKAQSADAEADAWEVDFTDDAKPWVRKHLQ